MRASIFPEVAGVLLLLVFIWSFIDPQVRAQGCGSALWGLVFLAREMFGLNGVRLLLLALSAMFFAMTVKTFWGR